MDTTNVHGFLNYSSELENLVNQSSSFHQHSVLGFHLLPNTPSPNANVSSTSSAAADGCDFSDASLLRYIDQMLMEEEDMEEETHMLQESLDFQAKEKSFYEVIGKKYPPSPQPDPAFLSWDRETPDHNYPLIDLHSSSSCISEASGGYLIDIIDSSWIDSRNPLVRLDSSHNLSNPITSSCSLSHAVIHRSSDFLQASPLQIHGVCSEGRPAWNFEKGVVEASEFLPSENNLPVIHHSGSLITQDYEGEYDSRTKRSHHNMETAMEDERSSKLSALNTDLDILVGEFDNMLLNSMGEGRAKFGAYREVLKNAVHRKGPIKGKSGRAKKQNKKKEVIDLGTLLINCAEAVAADDARNANELLKEIRHHSSPYGDGNQRLSQYLSDALEARLAGSGSKIYKSIVNRRMKATDYLRAYYTSLASAPFKKISNLATIQTIINITRKETKVHIIDFGVLYGFQWPTFIQRISKRENGPPNVKITGIDFPQQGFKPAERAEDTGRRLAWYARKFGVPFEYNAIAQKWETIKIEDLEIEDDAFLIVTCMYISKNLPDETVVPHGSRTLILNLIRKANPDIFIHGIVNGTYNAPFFLTRFREVLYHFSALFDMLEASVPREAPERMLIEREMFAREAFNVIACEGWERVERPETYKQWQVRNMKAGFTQVSFDREIIREAMEKVKVFFHKDFLIDEQNKWILLGWRGRIINAISCWKPV
ncbi:hypothetical protein OROGR_024188 [Orobanche gracilis]